MSCGHPEDPAMLFPGETLEDFVARYMSQFQYEETRHLEPAHDSSNLGNAFHQIKDIIKRDTSGYRLDCFIHILSLAYKIHDSIYRLRRYKRNPSLPFPEYVQIIKTTLDELLRDSYEDEKRKLEVIFGLVEVVAELLIVDIEVFELNPDPTKYEEAKTIRKLIANLLTNLVFGNAQSKRRLCCYSGFIPEVTKIIQNSPGLAVFYAALIRNLSWQADNSMKISLSRVVPSLSLAAIKAQSNGDSKCLLATLSALWNLGSHSMDNKKAMCETEGFLALIITLLDCVPGHTTMVENASGILKYACHYIIINRELLKLLHDAKLIRKLLNLLNSSSFTVVINALNSLCQLSKHDPITQIKLTKPQPRALLEKLRNSVHDEVRNTVKELLNHLNQSAAAGYYSMPRNPPQSMIYYSTSESAYSSGGSTLLPPTRNMFNPQYSPVVHPVGPYIHFPQQPHPPSQQQHQNTLPKSMRIFKHDQQPRHPQENNSLFLNDVRLEAGIDIPDSILATRSGSVQSLTDEMGTDNSWRSSDNTDAPNSADLSPVSESEIPDSPTEFAMKQVQKYGFSNSKKGSFEEDDEDDLYGIKMNSERTLKRDELSQVIDNALPQPKATAFHSLQSTPRLPKPTNVIHQPLFPDDPLDCTSEIDYDSSSVMDEPTICPPSSIPSSSTSDASTTTATMPKNEMTSTVTTFTGSPFLHQPLQVKMNPTPPSRKELLDAMKVSSLLQSPSTMEKLRDASQLCNQQHHYHGNSFHNEVDSDELSDDSYCGSSEHIALEDLTALPNDVDQAFHAEKFVIDCGSLSRGLRPSSKVPRQTNHQASESSDKISKIGLLSSATIKRLSKSRNPLPMPSPAKNPSNKNSKSARVSPFNYKEPSALKKQTYEKPATQQNSAKPHKLLVTTV